MEIAAGMASMGVFVVAYWTADQVRSRGSTAHLGLAGFEAGGSRLQLLTHGVQASARPSGRAGEILRALELILEVGLLLRRVVQEEGAVVEALDAGVGSSRSSRSSRGGQNRGVACDEGGGSGTRGYWCSTAAGASVGLVHGARCGGDDGGGRLGLLGANHFDRITISGEY